MHQYVDVRKEGERQFRYKNKNQHAQLVLIRGKCRKKRVTKSIPTTRQRQHVGAEEEHDCHFMGDRLSITKWRGQEYCCQVRCVKRDGRLK